MPPSPRRLFVNLAVRDLKKAMRVFGALGSAFDPKFTDDNAACMVVGDSGGYRERSFGTVRLRSRM